MMNGWTVGILLFDDVDLMDFAGPAEVFSQATFPDQTVDSLDERPFQVKTISERGGFIHTRNGICLQSGYSFANAPQVDILVVPGGYGAREHEVHNEILIGWLREQAATSNLIASVCTGAFLLAAGGLLDGRPATTHFASYDRFEKTFKGVTLVRDVAFVDDGDVLTSGGVMSGVPLALHIVARMLGEEVAKDVAHGILYEATAI